MHTGGQSYGDRGLEGLMGQENALFLGSIV